MKLDLVLCANITFLQVLSILSIVVKFEMLGIFCTAPSRGAPRLDAVRKPVLHRAQARCTAARRLEGIVAAPRLDDFD